MAVLHNDVGPFYQARALAVTALVTDRRDPPRRLCRQRRHPPDVLHQVEVASARAVEREDLWACLSDERGFVIASALERA